MKTLKAIALLIAILATATSSANAQTNEDQVRQTPDHSIVTLSYSDYRQFTAQGRLGDTLIVRTWDNRVYAVGTMADWFYYGPVTDWYIGSNGELVLRLVLLGDGALAGGTISVQRGGAAIDTDRIRVSQ